MIRYKSRAEDLTLIISFLYSKHDQGGGIPPHSSSCSWRWALYIHWTAPLRSVSSVNPLGTSHHSLQNWRVTPVAKFILFTFLADEESSKIKWVIVGNGMCLFSFRAISKTNVVLITFKYSCIAKNPQIKQHNCWLSYNVSWCNVDFSISP